MAKKSKEKKSNVTGKVIFSVVLAVGSAVAAYVASKFLGKKGELEQPAPDNDLDMEMTEDNYITLDNDIAPEAGEEEPAAEEAAADEQEAEAAEAVEAEEEALPEEKAAEEVLDDDDATRCIRD